jgi:hypothetical protein
MVFISMIVVALVLAAGFALLFARYKVQSDRIAILEGKLGISVVPFWGYLLSVIAELITHPHARYAEMDALIQKALLEPAIRMSDEDFSRLEILGEERTHDTSDDMRPGEQDAMKIFILAVKMVRLEALNKTALTGFTVVGRQEPPAQQSGEEPKLV